MVSRLILVKENRNKQSLLRDIAKEMKKTAIKLHKNIQWFRFAKMNRFDYQFYHDKSHQWKALQETADILSRKYKTFTIGEIVDMICDMVNNTVADEAHLERLRQYKNSTKKEKDYLNKLIIEVCTQKTIIFSRPWLMFKKKITNNSWVVKDLLSGHKYKVTLRIKGGFNQYNLETLE